MLVTVSTFGEPYEAHLFRGRLEAEGIAAFVVHEHHNGMRWDQSILLDGVKVQVNSGDRAAAQTIAQDCRLGIYKEVLRTEVGELDDVACPRCGCNAYHKRRPFFRAAGSIVISLFWMPVYFWVPTILPPLGWILTCRGCGEEYRPPARPFSMSKVILACAAAVTITAVMLLLDLWIYRAFGCSMWKPC